MEETFENEEIYQPKIIPKKATAYPSRFYQPSTQRMEQVGQTSDEELRRRCGQADSSTLINMARQHERIYNICYDELRGRGLLKTVESPSTIQSGAIPSQMISAMQRNWKSQM